MGNRSRVHYRLRIAFFSGIRPHTLWPRNRLQKQPKRRQQNNNPRLLAYLGKHFLWPIQKGLVRRALRHSKNRNHGCIDRRRELVGTSLHANASQLPLALSWLYLESFRIICAVHEGMFGEKTFNGFMAEILDKKMGDNGIPVIILRNDKETNLYNGDVGIFWNRRVYFPKWELNPAGHKIFNCRRSYEPHRLPEHTLAFAMTIHKSQGSGYDNVLMVLPDQDQRVISRELIYTGISRTKHCFELWGDRAIFEAAIDRPTCRWSGLPYLLN